MRIYNYGIDGEPMMLEVFLTNLCQRLSIDHIPI